MAAHGGSCEYTPDGLRTELDGSGRDTLVDGVEQLGGGRGQTVSPFAFLSICDDPALQLAAAKSFAWPTAESGVVETAAVKVPLRVGFAATAFHDHPVPRLVVDLLERLDRNRFETYAYALGPDTADPLRVRVASAVKTLTDLASMTAGDAMARMRRVAIRRRCPVRPHWFTYASLGVSMATVVPLLGGIGMPTLSQWIKNSPLT